MTVTLAIEIILGIVKLVQGLLPEGLHKPTEAELITLASDRATSLLKRDAAQVAKEDGIIGGRGAVVP